MNKDKKNNFNIQFGASGNLFLELREAKENSK